MFDPKTVKFYPTVNQRPRHGIPIKNVVIHATGGTFQGTITWFQSPRAQVSAHYLVDRDGTIVQFVKEENEAWHVCGANPFTIGIEHVDMWTIPTQKALQGGCMGQTQWWTNEQLKASAELTAYLLKKYKLPMEAIIGHNDAMLRRFGNNHQDPGIRFPWDVYKRLIREVSVTEPMAELDVIKADTQKAVNKGGRPRKNRLYE
jgi:N-acetyl-anhydromuramyl-L-alanine amidase AmpD